MNRFLKLAVLIVLTISLFGLAHPASAELTGRVQLGYGNASYEIFGGEAFEAQDWSGRFSASYTFEDLLFTGLFQYSRSLKETNISRNVGQAAANYLFLEQEILRVYGGLGYQFTYNSFEHPAIADGAATAISGRNFVGQAVVQIAIDEKFHTTATVTGSPWLKWTFHQGGLTNSNIDQGPSFTYQLDLSYDFSDDLGVQLGLLGGTFKVPAFADHEVSKAGYAGIHLGVTKTF